METLELVDVDEALGLLGEIAGLYGDNGGDPDGNGWLPSQPIARDEASAVLEAGLGRMVKVAYFDDDEEVAEVLDIQDVLALAQHTDDWQAFRNAVEDRVRLWAHYGAYGTGDSVWVVVR